MVVVSYSESSLPFSGLILVPCKSMMWGGSNRPLQTGPAVECLLVLGYQELVSELRFAANTYNLGWFWSSFGCFKVNETFES